MYTSIPMIDVFIKRIWDIFNIKWWQDAILAILFQTLLQSVLILLQNEWPKTRRSRQISISGSYTKQRWQCSNWSQGQDQLSHVRCMTRLATIWKSNSISFPIKFKLYKTLVLSILMYGFESWTLTTDLERRIQAFEHKCFRKLLRISYTEHKTNEFVRQQVTTYVGSQEPFLAIIKRCKLTWYGHVTCHDSLAKIILQGQGTIQGTRSRQKKSWFDNVKEWTTHKGAHLLCMAESRDNWHVLVKEASSTLTGWVSEWASDITTSLRPSMELVLHYKVWTN